MADYLFSRGLADEGILTKSAMQLKAGAGSWASRVRRSHVQAVSTQEPTTICGQACVRKPPCRRRLGGPDAFVKGQAASIGQQQSALLNLLDAIERFQQLNAAVLPQQGHKGLGM
jgi:hypothetical protein